MRTRAFVFGLLLLSTPCSLAAQEWDEFTSLQDGFRLTGLFLLRHVLEPRGQGHSDARDGFINAVMRQRTRLALP